MLRSILYPNDAIRFPGFESLGIVTRRDGAGHPGCSGGASRRPRTETPGVGRVVITTKDITSVNAACRQRRDPQAT
ncbi:MAG: hypothetical protein U1G08_09030 [Verrucomicrobiota bacterium]